MQCGNGVRKKEHIIQGANGRNECEHCSEDELSFISLHSSFSSLPRTILVESYFSGTICDCLTSAQRIQWARAGQ